MPLLKQDYYTTDYINALPEGKRAELIDGEIYDLASPSRIHQKILHILDKKIGNHIDAMHLPCEVYPAPFAVYINLDDYNYVEPDLSVICDRDKLSDRGCEGAPDWVIEIVSPSSQRMDYLIKLRKYQSAGVRLYWIIDPDYETVLAYDFEHDDMRRYRFSDDVPVGICEDFTIRLADYEIR